jgi:hypothetical protein
MQTFRTNVYSKQEGNTILQKVVSKYQTTRRHIPGDDNLRSHHRQNLASLQENFERFNFHNVVVSVRIVEYLKVCWQREFIIMILQFLTFIYLRSHLFRMTLEI